jgi:HflK protein
MLAIVTHSLAWVLDLLLAIFQQTGLVFYESAFFILIGFIAAGLLKEFVAPRLLERLIGKDHWSSVIWAALLGAPLPICACGILPLAVELRKKGASKSAIASFLISTPETGVDSIALTYALMGPVMAVVRPVMAILSAVTAGICTILVIKLGKNETTNKAGELSCEDSDADHHVCFGVSPFLIDEYSSKLTAKAFYERIFDGLKYALRILFDEISFWIFLGLVLTGILVSVLPHNFFPSALNLGSGILPMIVAVLIGVPIYVCASAATPLAAALIATGLSPGAALVFLLTGPATNFATIVIVNRLLGTKTLLVYLISIIFVAVMGGITLDYTISEAIQKSIVIGRIVPDGSFLGIIKWISVSILIFLFISSIRRGGFRHGIIEFLGQYSQVSSALNRYDWKKHSNYVVGVPLIRRTVGLVRLVFSPQNRRMVLSASVGTLCLIWLCLQAPSFTLVVLPGQQGIVQRFGKVVADDLGPGLHFHLPPPLGKGIAVETCLVRQVAVGTVGDPTLSSPVPSAENGVFLTGDENIIDIGAIVQYRVNNAARFELGVEHTDALIQNLARQLLVDIISMTPIDLVYSTQRSLIEHAFEEELNYRFQEIDMGYEIVAARLVYVHAPDKVHDAFRDVASALEDQTRAVLEAEGGAAVQLARAQGDVSEIMATAREKAFRMVTFAAGETEPFKDLARVYEGYPAVTRQRLHMESLERYLAKSRKYVMGYEGPGHDFDLWLGSLEKGAIKFRLQE